MEIVYFSKEPPREDDVFLRVVKSIIALPRIVTVSEINEFKKKLTEKPGCQLLAIVIAADEEMLIDIYFTRCLLSRISSILVLPDHEGHTAALGYRTGPDHVFPPNADIAGIALAVAKAMERVCRHTPPKHAEYTYSTTWHDRYVSHGEDKAANF